MIIFPEECTTQLPGRAIVYSGTLTPDLAPSIKFLDILNGHKLQELVWFVIDGAAIRCFIYDKEQGTNRTFEPGLGLLYTLRQKIREFNLV